MPKHSRQIEPQKTYSMHELLGFENLVRHNNNYRFLYQIDGRTYDVYGRNYIEREIYITSIWDRISKRQLNKLDLSGLEGKV